MKRMFPLMSGGFGCRLWRATRLEQFHNARDVAGGVFGSLR